jgi:16S rRNA (cytosine967-C5)-methyltransferase
LAGEKLKTARTIAAIALNRFDPKRNYAGTILNKLLSQTDEKQRATDLVFGTIRNRSAIDMVIAKLADCRIERIPAELLNTIRIGAYELIYCPATAEYSIVNEAVGSAKAVAGKKQAGFVNAVLRQIARHIQDRQISLSGAEPQRTLPQTPSAGCEFDTVLLPEPAASPADYFSSAFSLPKWLVADWLAEFGAEKARQICFASNRKPSIYIRPNRLKTTTSDLAEKFHRADINFKIVDDSMISIESPQAITQLAGFAEGLFTVQDITAWQVIKALKPQSGWTMLDLCAAPGTKTTQLAEFADDKAKIIATDIDSRRLEKVKENTARLGISSVRIVAYKNLEKIAAEAGPFDCILLDVPCSNTGVLAKRPEARYRISVETITELTKIQLRLLQAAEAMINPHGKICYSTCSIQQDENSRLIRKFLQRNCNFKLEYESLILPSAEQPDCDGGYTAILTGN